ncbi:MAG: putative GCN5-related acetyltransferase [Nocardia sp.]|uniref:GNAT family N-acetyltransferase n=1 Tax=Nocardia sp. TaxID=1821 RepID=UPI00263640C0|nr:GNAT family N-acetyltransferase [Nocardia sp.]MCU1640935.1 putative GCN5-related acetyltransferase [Nocardia sp.]
MTSQQRAAIPGLQFEHLSAAAARARRDTVEDIYRGAYVEAIQSAAPFADPAAFMTRFDAYTEPGRPSGFTLTLAVVDDQPIGQAWGWPLHADTAWWGGLQLDGSGDIDEFITEDGTRTFALSEIMVRSELTSRGVARALHDELLSSRTEQRATLLVRPANARAYQTYLRWGWYRVGTLRPSWPDAPQFDVLIHDLHRR